MKAVETSNFVETKHWTTVSREQICGQWSNVKVTGIKNVKKSFFSRISSPKWIDLCQTRTQNDRWPIYIHIVEIEYISPAEILRFVKFVCNCPGESHVVEAAWPRTCFCRSSCIMPTTQRVVKGQCQGRCKKWAEVAVFRCCDLYMFVTRH